MTVGASFEDLVAATTDLPAGEGRRLVAVAGPPASGKSSIAERLAATVTAAGRAAMVVPMDGFHLDNPELERIGLLQRKGAPETFDRQGFTELVTRLGRSGTVPFPTFDRAEDRVLPDSGMVPVGCDIAILEGNYLLFGEPGWRDLARSWDLSIWVEVSTKVLQSRLIDRWRTYGLPEDAALARAEGNDLPNARRIMENRVEPDLIYLNE